MAYIIDGHNLIPKVRGLRLNMLDDEEALIQLLQDFCRTQRKTVEVYFDRAVAGHAGKKRYGLVTAHFVREGSTADQAIILRLRKLKKAARNVIVVSSDRQIVSEVRSVGALPLRSEDFARMLIQDIENREEESPNLSPEEIEQWLDLFDSSS